MSKEKRYIATIKLYVWAKSDEEAKKMAAKIAIDIDNRMDNKAALVELHQNEFGSFNKRKIEI